MRKLIVCNLVSVDGFYAGPNDDVMAMPFDNGFSDYNAERLRAANLLLLGRKSFEMFRGYWPAIAGDPDQPEVEREVSRLNTAIEKLVVSDTLMLDETGGWGPVSVARRAKAHAEIAARKRAPGREMLVFGSRQLWNGLLGAGLVDELHLMIGAGLVGEGARAFETAGRHSLRLLESRPFENSNLTLVRYAVDS